MKRILIAASLMLIAALAKAQYTQVVANDGWFKNGLKIPSYSALPPLKGASTFIEVNAGIDSGLYMARPWGWRKLGTISSGDIKGSRFGKSGEDDIADSTRTFNLNGNFFFLDSIGGMARFQTKPTVSGYRAEFQLQEGIEASLTTPPSAYLFTGNANDESGFESKGGKVADIYAYSSSFDSYLFVRPSSIVVDSDSIKFASGTPGLGKIWTSDAAGYGSWQSATPPTGPAGSNRQIQFNNAGSFGAAAPFVYDASNRLGVATNTPTHTITMGIPSSGIALYNTVDMTTNYERLVTAWDLGTATISTEIAGTASPRNLKLKSSASLEFESSNEFNFNNSSGGIAKVFSDGNFLLQTGGPYTNEGYKFSVNGSSKHSGFVSASSGIGISHLFSPTLTATANSDTLVGIDINPAFSLGAFAGVAQIPFRAKLNTSTLNLHDYGSSPSTYHALELTNNDTSSNGGFSAFIATVDTNRRNYNSVYTLGSGGTLFGEPQGGWAASVSENVIGMGVGTLTNSPLIMGTNGVAAARIFPNGNILLQTAGTFTDIPSSKLSINSTTQGFLTPRLTKTEREAISSPATGLVIYQTDNTPGLRVYNGSHWVRFTETNDD